MTPAVSILLPTLNSMRFLRERMESIFRQTFIDWELIAADSFSNDGTFEFLQECAQKDSRISVFQVPKGLYQAWNFCVSKATGTYIYIATSDDLMRPECLAKMVQALEQNPQCDICDSILELVDENGKEISENSPAYLPHWWHLTYPRNKKHIRFAPHDYFLHLGGKTVYTSITQILIRKILFEKTGLFPTDFGCSADYLWGMRAAWYANIIFLPEKLASWRLHSDQATWLDSDAVNTRFKEMHKMAEQSLFIVKDDATLKIAKKLMKIISFKEILLPAKRKPSFQIFAKTIFSVFIRHPYFSFIFFYKALCCYSKICRKFWMIYSYDALLRSRIKKLHLEKKIRCIE